MIANNLPIFYALAAIAIALAILRALFRRLRDRFGRWLVRFGVWIGGQQAVARFLPPPAPVRDTVAEAAAVTRLEERRATVRDVRATMTATMTHAEADREAGVRERREGAIAAANRASAVVHEVDDATARSLVRQWKERWDAIPKAFGKDGRGAWLGENNHAPPGYPEPQWTELRDAFNRANERLGEVLRELLTD